MAKQRGIHQISGKINNLCYYEQKYVRGGLIRRINEAMSERLKTDPLFANTRRANTIFGGCSLVASVLLSFFGSRNTYLFKPYRHALLTREVQKFFLSEYNSLGYPEILDRISGFRNLPSIIDGIVKNSIFNSFVELERNVDNLGLEVDYSFIFSYESLENYCKKNKCIGVQLSVTRAHYIYRVGYNSDFEGYSTPENNAGGRISFFNWYLGEDTEDVTIFADTGTIDDAVTFWIVYASPIVRKNGDRPVTGQTGAACGVVTFLAE